MKLLNELIQFQSKAEQQSVVNSIVESDSLLEQLIEQVTSDNKRITQISTWVFRDYAKIKFENTLPYLDQVIHKFTQDKQHDAVYRNLGGYFSEHQFKFNEEQEGELLNKAFELLSHKASPVAIKIHCMTLLVKLTKKYPELKDELKFVIEEQLPYGSSGFKGRANKTLKALAK